MTDQIELDWLAEERPTPLPLDSDTSARVRAELLNRDPRKRPGRSFGRRHVVRQRALRIAVSGLALAAVGCGVVLVTQSGSGRAGSGVRALPVESASAKQLNHLSLKLADASALIGDATLVLRTQKYPDGSSITGADLYADNGNYYYSPAFSGLASAIRSGETVNTGASDAEVRDIAAAKAALTGPIEVARQQMSVANFDPGVKPQSASKTMAELAKRSPALAAALGKRLREVKANASEQNIKPEMTQENSMIWDNSMDALTAGAGDPQVRAGVLKLLATIPQIVVTQSTLGGQPTLVLSAALLSSKAGIYQEQLILNADSGVPVKFIGGNVGQTPGVTVDYSISRVTVSSIKNGTYAG
jgi:hypothetical protein